MSAERVHRELTVEHGRMIIALSHELEEVKKKLQFANDEDFEVEDWADEQELSENAKKREEEHQAKLQMLENAPSVREVPFDGPVVQTVVREVRVEAASSEPARRRDEGEIKVDVPSKSVSRRVKSESNSDALIAELQVLRDRLMYLEGAAGKWGTLQSHVGELGRRVNEHNDTLGSLQDKVSNVSFSLDRTKSRVSTLEHAITGDGYPSCRLQFQGLLDRVCEDITWIAGFENDEGFHLVWEGVKSGGKLTLPHVQVLLKAQARIRSAKVGTLTARLYEPYADIVNDVMMTVVAFDPETSVRRVSCSRAHSFMDPTPKTLDEAIDLCCPPEQRSVVRQLKRAHDEFTILLRELAREGTQRELDEAAVAIPEFIRRYNLG